MEVVYNAAKALHVFSFLFMSAPLFSLIVVNERALLGKEMTYRTDRYMENILKGQAARCYVFQTTALITGIVLLLLNGMGLRAIVADWVVMSKTLLLLLLMGLLSYVHLGIQPKIESLLSQVKEENIKENIAAQIRPLRLRRKRLATFCLFVVMTIIILGLQVLVHYNLLLNALLLVCAAAFSFRAYRVPVHYGWV